MSGVVAILVFTGAAMSALSLFCMARAFLHHEEACHLRWEMLNAKLDILLEQKAKEEDRCE